jgi:3'(2'), 5'-bisphosphate nucleotidase
MINTKSQTDIDQLLKAAVKSSLQAGEAILKVYQTDFPVEEKDDKTPLTLADKRAHSIIKTFLEPYQLPILSEEGKKTDFSERKEWKLFWMVDPLDGTKEFIKRNGEFTVNIALIEEGKPVLGIVFSPVLKELYFGAAGWGARKTGVEEDDEGKFSLPILQNSKKLPVKDTHRPYTVVGSRSHSSAETERFIEKLRNGHPDLTFTSKGSSLKLCLIAEGAADIYPRLAPTMEWDTAAGHAVVTHAGGKVVQFETSEPLAYNKENLLNPWFIAMMGE